jgi:dihydrofolate reductase
MGRVVVTEFLSLDGVFEDPGGSESFEHGGWSFKFDRGEDGNKFKFEELMAADASLLGRITYEGFAKAWPEREGEFADKMNGMPKFVVSTTMERADWNNTTIIRDRVPDEVATLKSDHEGDLLIAGSGKLVRSLMEHDLVDEFRLMVFPLVLGKGRRLFDGARLSSLRLTDMQQVGPDGVAILTYEPAR